VDPVALGDRTDAGPACLRRLRSNVCEHVGREGGHLHRVDSRARQAEHVARPSDGGWLAEEMGVLREAGADVLVLHADGLGASRT
jgi:hypothetical protein